MKWFAKSIISLYLLGLLTIALPFHDVSASSLKGFIVLASSYSDLIVSDGTNFYSINYSWDCSSSDFSVGETIWIDTYYSPGYGNTILVEGLFDTETCSVTYADDLNLKTYYVNEEIGSDQILIEDVYGNEYLVEYGTGCLSMWRYEDDYIYIDIGGYSLDGISDTIYLFDSDDECRVWEVDDFDPVPTSTYTYVDVTPPDMSLALASVYTDSSKNYYGVWEDATDGTPYFSWEGVSDVSGFIGYHVYFGKSVKDPAVYGESQTSTEYSASVSEPGDYYLVISATDFYNNTSSYYSWKYSYIGKPVVERVKIPEDEEVIEETLIEDSPGAFIPSMLDNNLLARLKGYILLQTESHGEAWYMNPEDGLRYYMKDGEAAYQMMRKLSLGITDADLAKIPEVADTTAMDTSVSVCSSNTLAKRLKGYILLQTEQHGEAWYIDPDKCRRIYMKNGEVAYSLMRYLSLGITNADLQKLPTGTIK